jgi:dTDP-D-glucose 4,6-dehydratase
LVPKAPNYDRLRPYLGWINVERIQETLRNTTQWFRADSRWPLRHHFKTRFPAANVPRLNETVYGHIFC